jgi:hypothetical protein
MNLPINIINNILSYVAELNNEVVYIKYDTNEREMYKINFFSNKLWGIQAIHTMKRFYPIHYSIQRNEQITKHMELYKNGKEHYIKKLLQEITH